MIPGILLSAGQSRRFGSQKLLIPYAKGLTIFEHSLRTHLVAGISPLVLVISKGILSRFFKGEWKDKRYRLTRGGVPWFILTTPWGKARVMVNEDPQAGMSLSLRLGLKGLHDSEKQMGVLVSLSDLPKISPEIIRSLVKTFQETRADMVVPTYKAKTGHPVIFREPLYREAVSKIQGDKGLREIIRSKMGKILLVPWEDDAVVADVDTPADLNRIFQEGMMIYGD